MRSCNLSVDETERTFTCRQEALWVFRTEQVWRETLCKSLTPLGWSESASPRIRVWPGWCCVPAAAQHLLLQTACAAANTEQRETSPWLGLVQSTGCWTPESRVQSPESRVQGPGFRVQGSGPIRANGLSVKGKVKINTTHSGLLASE